MEVLARIGSNFEGSLSGGDRHGRCATRRPFVRNPDQCARPTRGFPGRCAPAHLLRSLSSNLRIEGAADPSIQRIGFRLPVEAEYRGSADTHNPDFTISSTHVHDRETPIPIRFEEVFSITSESLINWNCCSRTLRLRVAFDPQFLYPPESGAQVIPVVRLDVLLVQFVQARTRSNDYIGIVVISNNFESILAELEAQPAAPPSKVSTALGLRSRCPDRPRSCSYSPREVGQNECAAGLQVNRVKKWE